MQATLRRREIVLFGFFFFFFGFYFSLFFKWCSPCSRYFACSSSALCRPLSLRLPRESEWRSENVGGRCSRPCRPACVFPYHVAMNQVLFLLTLCIVRTVLLRRTDHPFPVRLSLSVSDSLILKTIFFSSLLPLLVRIDPLVKVEATGVEFWFGPAPFRFSVAQPHGSTHSPPLLGLEG